MTKTLKTRPKTDLVVTVIAALATLIILVAIDAPDIAYTAFGALTVAVFGSRQIRKTKTQQT